MYQFVFQLNESLQIEKEFFKLLARTWSHCAVCMQFPILIVYQEEWNSTHIQYTAQFIVAVKELIAMHAQFCNL